MSAGSYSKNYGGSVADECSVNAAATLAEGSGCASKLLGLAVCAVCDEKKCPKITGSNFISLCCCLQVKIWNERYGGDLTCLHEDIPEIPRNKEYNETSINPLPRRQDTIKV